MFELNKNLKSYSLSIIICTLLMLHQAYTVFWYELMYFLVLSCHILFVAMGCKK